MHTHTYTYEQLHICILWCWMIVADLMNNWKEKLLYHHCLPNNNNKTGVYIYVCKWNVINKCWQKAQKGYNHTYIHICTRTMEICLAATKCWSCNNNHSCVYTVVHIVTNRNNNRKRNLRVLRYIKSNKPLLLVGAAHGGRGVVKVAEEQEMALK